MNSALHPCGVTKSSTSFGWGNSKNVTAVGWQVTLYDPIWHVISRNGVLISLNCYIHFTLQCMLGFLNGLKFSFYVVDNFTLITVMQ